MNGTYRSPRFRRANGVEQPCPPKNWDDLLRHASQQQPGAQGEDHVMQLEERVEFEGLTRLHELLETENYRQI